MLDLLRLEARRQRQLHGDGVAVEHIVGDGNRRTRCSAIDLDGGNGRCLKGQLAVSKVSSLSLNLDSNFNFHLIVVAGIGIRL